MLRNKEQPMTAQTQTDVRALAAPLLELLAAEADRADRDRRLPAEVVEPSRRAGLFRLAVPRALGGIEADLPGYLGLLEDVSGALGSMGWCIAVTTGSVHALAVQFPPEHAREALAAAGAGAIITGTLPPLGRATPSAGGYTVSGRWPFASLTEHADWRMVGTAAPGPPPHSADPRIAGENHLRYCLVPPGTQGMTLHDTWHVLSMRASGSCDLELRDVFVPAQRSAAVTWNQHRAGMVGLLRVPFSVTQGMSLGAIGLGIARVAFDAVVERAGRPRGPLPPASNSAPLQLAVADAAVEIAAGQAVLAREAVTAWTRAQQDEPISTAERLPWWTAAYGASQMAIHAVERLYALSGAHALYDDVPLQRYFRDVRVPQHHIHLHPGETAQDIGRTLLGLPPERRNW
jgi:indole-3-acetate monooxygenase